jgi:hypothetical protein
MALSPPFEAGPILKYLSLDIDYTPSPSQDPIEFLKRHMSQLPPHLLVLFSAHPQATPRARASIPVIRNRRCTYAAEGPKALDPDVLSRVDADVWDLVNEERPQGHMTKRPTVEQDEDAADERAWADEEFQGGMRGHVGKIGELLAELEEERTRERQRAVRRQATAARTQREETEEEEEESSDEEEERQGSIERQPDASDNDLRKIIRERFISGLLSVGRWF